MAAVGQLEDGHDGPERGQQQQRELEERMAGMTIENKSSSDGAFANEIGYADGSVGKDRQGGEAVRNSNGIANASSSNEDENGEQVDEATQRELEGLALSSSITELGYAIESAFTLIFEVQELRHLASSTDSDKAVSISTDAKGDEPSQSSSSAISAVDAALIRLDAQLEDTSNEVSSLQARLEAFWLLEDAPFLRQKWNETSASWQRAVRETETMREELVEDKYLTVYRTVSKQAEDMMLSLEKIFNQCTTFVHDVHKKHGASRSNTSTSSSSSAGNNLEEAEALQSHLNTFIALNKSLHQKSKYYLPSCERVLKVIDSGIAQQKSLNGEVLRSHADMKLRWRNLRERMARVENEMTSVQDLLGELSDKSKSTSMASASAHSKHKSSDSLDAGNSISTPARSSNLLGRNRSSQYLTPSPPVKSSPPSAGSSSRAISPFRKLASRFSRSRNGDGLASPPPPLPSRQADSSGRHSPVSTASSSMSSSARHGTSHAPHNSNGLNTSPSASQSASPRRFGPIQPHSAAYASASGTPARLQQILRQGTSSTVSERLQGARSPIPTSIGATYRRPSSSLAGSSVAATRNGNSEIRPKWNTSTKPDKEEALPSLLSSVPLSSTSSGSNVRPRQSMLFGTPSRAMSPSGGNYYSPARGIASGRITPSGYPSRPVSRNFTAPVPSFARPASPAMSTSSNMSASAFRARPSSPNSRIPAPAQASIIGSVGNGTPASQSRRASTAIGLASSTPSRTTGSRAVSGGDHAMEIRRVARGELVDEDDNTETLFFNTAGDTSAEHNTSIMQRAFSPTPSAGGMSSVTSAEARRQSHIPRLNVSTSSQNNTPLPSPARSAVSGRKSVTGGYGRDMQTPEPMLRTRAARASAIYGGSGENLKLPSSSPAASSTRYSGTSPVRQGKSSFASSSSVASGTPASQRPPSRHELRSSAGTPSGRRSSLLPRSSTAVYDESFQAFLSSTSYHGDTLEGSYIPNHVDPLDVEIAGIVNSQPGYIHCQRVDLPLNRAAALAQKRSERTARYTFKLGSGDASDGFGEEQQKSLSCKLVERQGRESKVMVRVGGSWIDLRMFLLDKQTQY